MLVRRNGKFHSSGSTHSHSFSGRWLYSLFLALDANFRLKRKDVSSDKRDGGLSLGWAYIVNNEPYKEHLLRYKDEVELVGFSFPFS